VLCVALAGLAWFGFAPHVVTRDGFIGDAQFGEIRATCNGRLLRDPVAPPDPDFPGLVSPAMTDICEKDEESVRLPIGLAVVGVGALDCVAIVSRRRR